MTKEQLKELGLDETQIAEVFKLNGLAITKVQSDLDTTKKQLDETKTLLEDANTKIEGFKDLDVDAIKKEAEDYKLAYEKAEADAKAKIEALEYETALKEYMNKYNFVNDRVKNSIMNDIKTKEFKLEEGKFLGADDYIKQLQEKEPESFAVEKDEEKSKFIRPTTSDTTSRKEEPKTIAELAKEASIRR